LLELSRDNSKIQSDRIDASVQKILKEIKKAATEGKHEILFSAANLEYRSEVDMVKSRLEQLGYSIWEESDMDLKYEMIHW
jgi:tRNA A37 methylthiotransferase MiaB